MTMQEMKSSNKLEFCKKFIKESIEDYFIDSADKKFLCGFVLVTKEKRPCPKCRCCKHFVGEIGCIAHYISGEHVSNWSKLIELIRTDTDFICSLPPKKKEALIKLILTSGK